MAKGRSGSRQRQLNKAVAPGFAQIAAAGRRNGGNGSARPWGLLDAINMATGQDTAYGFEPLPRQPGDDSPFGPLTPLTPEAINPLNADGRTTPRTWEYQVGWNLPGSGQREVPWAVLRGAADGVGIIRRCIEVRKKHIRDLNWVFAPTERAIQDAYLRDRSKGKMDVEAEMRERLLPEINRLTEFWESPWRSNDVSLGQWINAVMEDYLVLDAVSVYPQMSYGNEVLDLRYVDSTTIKPLLDEYGNRPAHPHPAFQQVLYGFPRGEWTPSLTQDEEGNAVLSNGFARSELFYYRENVRSNSPYGKSAVEMALFDARLYLQRQKWMLAEYDDGSTPLTFIETAEAQDGQRLSLTQKRQWEQAFNSEYGGQTAQRMRIKVMPAGWKAQQLTSVDERYKPEYDLHLIKLVASFFGVPVAELGFTEPTGLGNQSWHQGQADVSGRLGKKPDTAVVGDIINALCRQFLRMPKEISFNFADPSALNTQEAVTVSDILVKGGQASINEQRGARGESLLPFAEANMPFILGGPQGIIFLDGAKATLEAAAEQAALAATTAAAGTAGKLELEGKKLEDGKEAREADHELQRETRDLTLEQQAAKTEKAAMAELQAFRNWRRKHGAEPKRPFIFKSVTPDDGWPELENLGPETVSFGDEWIWLEDELEKRAKSGLTWEMWNARNPGKQRDARGRWVRAGSVVSSLVDALKAENERGAGTGRVSDASSTVEGMTESKARQLDGVAHQEQVDRAKGRAALLAELSGLLADEAPQDVLQHRALARMRQHKLSDEPMFQSLAENVDAKGIDFVARELGFRQFSTAGELSTMDARDHMPFGTHIETGAPVRVMRPGYEYTVGGERHQLKATVERDTSAPAEAPQTPDGRIAELEAELAELEGKFDPVSRNLRRELRAEINEIKIGEAEARGKVTTQRLKAKDILPGMAVDVSQLYMPGVGASSSGFAARNGGEARFVEVGRVVNTRKSGGPGMASFATGQYLVYDRAGEPLGRLSANSTIPTQTAATKEHGREVPTGESTDVLMENARQGIAAEKLGKLGTVQKEILRNIGNGQRVPEGTRGAKGMGNLLQLSEHKDYYELSDLGRAAFAQMYGLSKAADADPKAQEPVTAPLDQRWPGWLMDVAIASAAGAALLAAMRGLLTPTGLLAKALGRSLRMFGMTTANDPVPDFAAVLKVVPGLVEEVARAIGPPIRQAHLEGGLTGERSAGALIDFVQAGEGNDARSAVEFDIDWSGWSPGHPEAARLLLTPGGLARLLELSDVTVRRIAENRLDRLGHIIGVGLSHGDSPEKVGRAVAAEFGNESWAHMVALTETSRAQSAAAVNQYQESGLRFKGWMTALDQRVCRICFENEFNADGSPREIPIDALFPSGDPWPPAHPRCRCAPIPVWRNPRSMTHDLSGSVR